MTQFGFTTPLTTGLTRKSEMRSRSGWQRDSKSGRGLPKMSFIPCVIMKAVASERQRPIQPVFSSHSFLLQMSALGVPLLAVGPGTKIMQTKKTMAPGAMSATTTSSHVGIISWCWNGYEMFRSTGEKGRLYGKMYSKPAPIAAIALRHVSHGCLVRG